MQRMHRIKIFLAMAGALLVLGTGLTAVMAVEPCGDFGECKVLIEINATDGDIGFHFLMDGDDLVSGQIVDPNGKRVFAAQATGPLRDQELTETFGESAEPLCWSICVGATLKALCRRHSIESGRNWSCPRAI